MRRVAIVAPDWAARDVLTQVADAGVVELEQPGGQQAAVEDVVGVAVRSRYASAWAGWMPTDAADPLAVRIGARGGAVVPLPRPRGEQPPTLLRRRSGSAFTSLVETYSTVPYADLDPTVFAAVAYVVMFGLMFGDVGHGLLLLGLGLAARRGHWRRLRRLRPAASVVIGAGAAATAAGAAYGEVFGPTGAVPALWLSPLDDPVRLLVGGLAVGAVLLAMAYGIGTVNRVREGGWAYALYAPSGIAGATVFLGLGLLVAGVLTDSGWLVVVATVVSTSGLGLSFVGLYVGAGRGGSAAAQAVVELVDLVVRLGSNVVSFARLAAFGLTHAALGAVVWSATAALWGRSAAASVAAVAVLVVGNAVAFALEALVAAVQALRLEYYELFSRVFDLEGRPFRPWHVPLRPAPTPAPDLLEASS
ncbi:V-type ATPase 116kDa subunit family protein [Angustibacter sp. Root456]|uniref:V-type ATPase 116kDa subunit family protein n=1 Tax=Angustibacter sp. Root456 TaxID=1736539 RepID=UPI0009EA8BE6|nr:V-type ATPase 116kDa subunit family protein [Angustibacter sp. Root456]